MGPVLADPRGTAQGPRLVEEACSGSKVTGAPLGPPWNTVDWDATPDWEFTSAADDRPEELYKVWDDAVASSRARLAAALVDGGLDQSVDASGPGGHASLRRLLCDLIEEYGRHTGHADLLREEVDGLVGEDPPPGWRPSSTP